MDAARLGRIDEAKHHIEKLSARARKDTRAKELIEVVYIEDINNSLQKGQTDEALESINVLIGYYPEEMNYYFYRGNIYEAIEDYERALEDYLFVTETVKNSDKVWFSAGRAAYNTGRLSDAKKYWKRPLNKPKLPGCQTIVGGYFGLYLAGLSLQLLHFCYRVNPALVKNLLKACLPSLVGLNTPASSSTL